MAKNIGNRKSGIVVRTGVKAGGLATQHNRKSAAGVRVKAGVRVGGMSLNHNRVLRRA